MLYSKPQYKKRPHSWERKILATEAADPAEDLPDGVAIGVSVTAGAGKDKHPSDLLVKFVSRGQV